MLGVTLRVTPDRLWRTTTGRQRLEVTAAMRHGTALEPLARAAHAERARRITRPQCCSTAVTPSDWTASRWPAG